jgi:hypothetical protein
MRRHAAAFLAAALLTGLLAPEPARAYDTTSTFIASADGTKLHTAVFRKPGAKRPVILLVSPYLGESTVPARAELVRLVENGYAAVQVSLRGFGRSEGCGDFGGVGEQADVKAAVEWAASQPWSTGRVGMLGVSYEAWTQVMALATKPRGLAAVLIQSPLVSLYRGLYMNGAHYGGGWHATPASYAVQDLTSTGATEPTTAPCYLENNSETANPDESTPYWKERDLVARARTSTVPVLWSHGFLDANTRPDNLTALYPLLRGPKRAWVGQFAHMMPADKYEPDVRDLYLDEAFDFLDAYVRRDPAALRRVKAQGGAVIGMNDGSWRRDDAWPPRDSKPATFALRSGSFADVVTNDGGTGHDAGAVHWSFSQRLPYAVHMSGVPRVTLTAKGAAPAQVVVKVYDVEAEGPARMVTRGVHALVDGKVSFDLYPQDWYFERGHRIAVAVLGSDTPWWSPTTTGGVVNVTGATLRTPVLRYDRMYGPFLYTDGLEANPQFTVTDAVANANETTFKLPPRMRRR